MGKYPNSGIIYRNKDRKSERHPEYTGHCEIDGRQYWISAWVKDGQKGKFFSLAFKPRDVAKQAEQAKAATEQAGEEDSSAPF